MDVCTSKNGFETTHITLGAMMASHLGTEQAINDLLTCQHTFPTRPHLIWGRCIRVLWHTHTHTYNYMHIYTRRQVFSIETCNMFRMLSSLTEPMRVELRGAPYISAFSSTATTTSRLPDTDTRTQGRTCEHVHPRGIWRKPWNKNTHSVFVIILYEAWQNASVCVFFCHVDSSVSAQYAPAMWCHPWHNSMFVEIKMHLQSCCVLRQLVYTTHAI